MFSLVRGGPKILIFESSRIQELSDYLIQEKKADSYDFDAAFEKAGEDYTIIFIIDKITDVVDLRQIKDALIIMEEPDAVLCNLLNDKMNHLITRARIATRIIILRAMGDLERVVREISEDYKCIEGNLIEVLNTCDEKGTILAITDKPIHRTMSVNDMYKKALFVEERYRPLLRNLRSHALKYLNSGLANKDI
ncbi:MAG: hypothetical protein ACYCYE_12580 [Clostridia bacterium]